MTFYIEVRQYNYETDSFTEWERIARPYTSRESAERAAYRIEVRSRGESDTRILEGQR